MLKDFSQYIKESREYKPENLVQEICVSMVLLNNEFLDNLLDRGNKARYTEDSSVFLTDLKNLLIKKNRLKLGKFEGSLCVEDEDVSKVNSIFDSNSFSIESDWNRLIYSRNIARSIIDKLLPDGKLTSESIESVFFIGPNKTDDNKEDIVIQTVDGKQYSFFLNQNPSSSKTSSFNKLADDLIGDKVDELFKGKYYELWTLLAKNWVTLIYDNSKENVRSIIDRFIVKENIKDLDYFNYFKIVHSDDRFKHLGEYIQIFDKNIKTLHELLTEIWKKRSETLLDSSRVEKEWTDIKNIILHSKIIENILTTYIKSNSSNKIQKLSDGFKLASGDIKMKLMKNLVDKLGSVEKDVYYVSSNGENFETIPSRSFFRDNYESIDLKFDYHVRFDNNSKDFFLFNVKLDLNKTELIDLSIEVGFSGSEMSGKLNAKYKFTLPKNFNYLIKSI